MTETSVATIVVMIVEEDSEGEQVLVEVELTRENVGQGSRKAIYSTPAWVTSTNTSLIATPFVVPFPSFLNPNNCRQHSEEQ
jgi:hypothetical protein